MSGDHTPFLHTHTSPTRAGASPGSSLPTSGLERAHGRICSKEEGTLAEPLWRPRLPVTNSRGVAGEEARGLRHRSRSRRRAVRQ